MKTKVFFPVSGIGAILLTSLLYLIDSDAPYADFKMRVIEFSIISAVFFALFNAIFFGFRFVDKLNMGRRGKG